MKCRIIYSSFKLILVAVYVIISLFSCESSRVGPEYDHVHTDLDDLMHPHLILNGNVKDASTLEPVNGATVFLTKTDGTIISTLLSDNSGKYFFDASNVMDASINVRATKTGFAYGERTAEINKTANSASVKDILLTKLHVATFNVTVGAGGSASATNNQSVAGQSLIVQVPANAVTSEIKLFIAAIPAGQIPQPTNSNTVILSAGQFGPSGTQFSQPVTINFPLPYHQTPGTTYAVMRLNEQTNAYTNSGFTATINADGTSASAQVVHFTTYVLKENIALTLKSSDTSISTEQYISLTSGNTSKQFPVVNTINVSGNDLVNEEWIKDIVACKLMISPDSSSQLLNFARPGSPSQYILNGVQVAPPGHAGEKGNWEYRWYYALQTITTDGTALGQGWSRTITVTSQDWIITHQGWYWIPDENGEVSGPY